MSKLKILILFSLILFYTLWWIFHYNLIVKNIEEDLTFSLVSSAKRLLLIKLIVIHTLIMLFLYLDLCNNKYITSNITNSKIKQIKCLICCTKVWCYACKTCIHITLFACRISHPVVVTVAADMFMIIQHIICNSNK